jgi:hemoglobin
VPADSGTRRQDFAAKRLLREKAMRNMFSRHALLGLVIVLGVSGSVGLALMQQAGGKTEPAKPGPAAGQKPAAAAETLYKRLGGYDALAAVTDDFLGRLIEDPRFAKFFVGHSTDSKNRIRQLIVDQLCAVTGGPCVYTGRSMKESHAGLGLAEEDWNASVVLLVATLDKFQVPQKEKDDVLALVSTLKGDIVEKK